MEKMKMQTADLADEKFRKLMELFPNAVTESIDENGEVVRAIDKDVLMQEISTKVVDGPEERYQFTWPDKRAAARLASAPIRATLRPCREESVDFDKTENLYIEGDNLDVLKLLRETYLGKVKMIYIDPPYNTGNDFVYEDDFAGDTDEFLSRDEQFDEQGNRLVQNTDSNGRFHTDWLNMIYPRLKIAKDLLADDGVIFISIDENELDNLQKVCNDIFGDDDFINVVSVKTKIGGVSGSSEGKSLRASTEYILIYAKDKTKLNLHPTYIATNLSARIKNYDEEGKSWKYTSVMTELGEKEIIKKDEKRGMNFYGYRLLTTKSISTFAKEQGLSEDEVYDQFAEKIFQTTNAQSSIRQTVMQETDGCDYPMYGCEYIPIKGKNEGKNIEVLYKGEQRRMMMFLSDAVTRIDGKFFYLDKVTTSWDDIQFNNLTKEGDIEFPNGKKPIKMLQRLMDLSTDNDSIVMDFFSGSASTAHAVMQENIEKGGMRKFIMVQLPEICDVNSDFYKHGFKNICEIGKERIRRAGRKIKEENGLSAANLDIGFRVLKLDSTNMEDVYYNPGETKQDGLFDHISNIKSDRSGEDLLFQVMLEFGILPSSKIEKSKIAGKEIFNVADNFLIACFDENVTDAVVTAIAKLKPTYVVLRDSSFSNDSVAANFEQIFATYSPDTTRRIL